MEGGNDNNNFYIGIGLIIVAIIFFIAYIYELLGAVGGTWWFWTFPILVLLSGGVGIYFMGRDR